MTTTGKLFRGWVEAVVEAHGFGSNRMVHGDKNRFMQREVMRGERLVSKGNRAKESTCIGAEEFEAALAGKEEGLRIWDELHEAQKWLLENGYIREYSFSKHGTVAGTGGRLLCNFRHYTVYGITAKGWAVAQKYLDSDPN